MSGSKVTQKGQAAVEMAVFGSLIMVCFAVLLSYAQTFTEQQTIQQQAFRMALRNAYGKYDDNDKQGMAGYTILKHHRTPSIFGNFGQGNRESISASATVLWSKGTPDQYAFYQVNDNVEEVPTHEEETDGGEKVDVPNEVWDVRNSANTTYSGEEAKEENTAMIRTSRTANLVDTVNTTLKVRYEDEDGNEVNTTDITFRQGLCADGRYRRSCADDTITKGRSWETPH